MRTVGEVLRQTRKEKDLSLDELEKETKIKKEFISYIENEKWKNLPEYPVVQGFVKNIAGSLEMEEKQVVARLRRDYPPDENLQINPKPDVSKKFIWSPKLTFISGVILVILLISSYLGFQYINFISPPELNVNTPIEGSRITENQIVVSGETDADATVSVNNQPVLVEDTGAFSTEIDIVEETEEIVVVAVSRSGKKTSVVRTIDVELE